MSFMSDGKNWKERIECEINKLSRVIVRSFEKESDTSLSLYFKRSSTSSWGRFVMVPDNSCDKILRQQGYMPAESHLLFSDIDTDKHCPPRAARRTAQAKKKRNQHT